jgi:hypothetical protein
MKRLGGIWPQVVSFENLLLAYRKARRGKGRSPDVARFALDLEKELLRLRRELEDGTYWPGAYRLFEIYERKPRTIVAAPFRDRVVHHAVMNLIEPPLDRTFIHDSYACRRGKGVHAAVDRYQGWARRHAYALKMDVARYVPSIDHQILKEKLRRRIKDPRVLALLDRIIDTSPPVDEPPVYFPGDDLLTPLEHRCGIPIGYLVLPNHRRLRSDNGHRFRRRLRRFAQAYAEGKVTFADFDPAVQSWIGHAIHADTLGLRRAIFSRIVFRRGTGREAAGAWCAGGERRPLVQWTNAAERTASRDARLGGRPWMVHCSTNRRTSARTAATGTRPTIGTTTSVSVSPSPPARPEGLSPEPACPRTDRAWCAGVHEPVSRSRKDASAE